MDSIDYSSDSLDDDFFGDFTKTMLAPDADADMPLQEYPRDAPVLFPLAPPTQNQPAHQLAIFGAPLSSTAQAQATASSTFPCVVSEEVKEEVSEATEMLFTAPAKKKRHQIARACQVCRRAKAKCTETRPCPRCVRLNIAGCEPSPSKGTTCTPQAAAKNGIHSALSMHSQPPLHTVKGVFV
jgi:hypothetical protein